MAANLNTFISSFEGLNLVIIYLLLSSKYYFSFFTFSLNMATPEHLQLQLRALPNNPGVYQFFDTEGRLLYVGKAKSLKKRVSSYFNKEHYSGRTALMEMKGSQGCSQPAG
jgi:hypothetical protein